VAVPPPDYFWRDVFLIVYIETIRPQSLLSPEPIFDRARSMTM
jgi:hypothetical protein